MCSLVRSTLVLERSMPGCGVMLNTGRTAAGTDCAQAEIPGQQAHLMPPRLIRPLYVLPHASIVLQWRQPGRECSDAISQ